LRELRFFFSEQLRDVVGTEQDTAMQAPQSADAIGNPMIRSRRLHGARRGG